MGVFTMRELKRYVGQLEQKPVNREVAVPFHMVAAGFSDSVFTVASWALVSPHDCNRTRH